MAARTKVSHRQGGRGPTDLLPCHRASFKKKCYRAWIYRTLTPKRVKEKGDAHRSYRSINVK